MPRRFFDFSVKVDATTMVTSALDLARRLWRYGEPDLATRTLVLPPQDVLAVGRRIVSIATSGDAARIWPDGPNGRPVLLASIEWLEGSAQLRAVRSTSDAIRRWNVCARPRTIGAYQSRQQPHTIWSAVVARCRLPRVLGSSRNRGQEGSWSRT
jgi:hypothetical protein